MTVVRKAIRPATSPDTLLVGWDEIARYMRRSKRALRHYVLTLGLPVIKVGNNVSTSRALIDTWIVTYGHVARSRKPKPKRTPVL